LAKTLTGHILSHDLAGWVDDGGNLDPTPGEADVNALQLPASHRLGAEPMPDLGHDLALIGYSTL
jgi:hypothetical protein